MSSVSFALLWTVSSLGLLPADPPTAPFVARAREAARRGLRFVEADGVRWMKEKKCASCHHVPMALLTHAEGLRRGFAAESEAIIGLQKSALDSYIRHPKLKPVGQDGTESAISPNTIYLSLGAGTVPRPDADTAKALEAFTTYLLAVQQKDGSWGDPGGGTKVVFSPLADTNEVVTMWALLALTAQAPKGDTWPQARTRAMAYLEATPPGDGNQSRVLRIMVRHRLGGSDEGRKAAKDLVRRQNADGGWSQVSDRPSDALATGQSLYALGTVGTAADDPAVQRAWAFLLEAQQGDGSWKVKTRVPKGTDSIISYYGSGWAVLGLLRTLPEEK